MPKVMILVEGDTEETFVKQVLVGHVSHLDIKTINLNGVKKYSRVKKDVQRLLRDASASLVTTMLDYYGLPQTFPGKASPRGTSSIEKVRYLEAAFQDDINDSRFRAYYSLHEFEALLFSSPDAIADVLKPDRKGKKSLMKKSIMKIRASFATPEDIDDGQSTAPSKRLKSAHVLYLKTVHGLAIAKTIGLQTIRAECPHFNEWLCQLESLEG